MPAAPDPPLPPSLPVQCAFSLPHARRLASPRWLSHCHWHILSAIMGPNFSGTQKVGQKGGHGPAPAAQCTDAHGQEGALFDLYYEYREMHTSL